MGNSYKKVLYCNSPKNLNSFLPFLLDKVFLTLPLIDYYPQFNLQNLRGDGVLTSDLNANTFGLIIIIRLEDMI